MLYEIKNEKLKISADTFGAELHSIFFDGIEYDITGIVPNYATQDYMKLICESRRAGAKDDFC